MSIDYYLHNNHEVTKISPKELEQNLPSDLLVEEVKLDETNTYVTSFTVKNNKVQNPLQIEFILQPDGYFWTYTYDYSEDKFGEFLEIIQTVAEKMNLLIDDPQLGEIDIKPSELNLEKMAEIALNQKELLEELPSVLSSSGLDTQVNVEELEKYMNEKAVLSEMYEKDGYYIDDVQSGTTPEGAFLTFCSWLITLNTVFPEVELVVVSVSPDENSDVYLVNLHELSEKFPDIVEKVTSPVMHYKAKGVNEADQIQKILEIGVPVNW